MSSRIFGKLGCFQKYMKVVWLEYLTKSQGSKGHSREREEERDFRTADFCILHNTIRSHLHFATTLNLHFATNRYILCAQLESHQGNCINSILWFIFLTLSNAQAGEIQDPHCRLFHWPALIYILQQNYTSDKKFNLQIRRGLLQGTRGIGFCSETDNIFIFSEEQSLFRGKFAGNTNKGCLEAKLIKGGPCPHFRFLHPADLRGILQHRKLLFKFCNKTIHFVWTLCIF